MFNVLTSKIFGGLAIALLLLLGMQTLRVNHLSGKLDKQVELTKKWKDAQQITRSSLDDVIAALAEKNAESRERAKKLEASKLKAEADAKRNAEADRSTQQQIDAMPRARGTRSEEPPSELQSQT